MLFMLAFASLTATGTQDDTKSTGTMSGGDGEIPISWLEPRTASEMGITSFNEPTMLKPMVDSGELEPVEKRLPKDPLVIEALNEVGKYGGTIRTSVHDTLLWSDLGHVRLSFLFSTDPSCAAVIPDISKSYELSDDGKDLTIFLREGMKWSDGAPMTADDYMWYYEEVMTDPVYNYWSQWLWMMGGELAVWEKIDDYTFKIKMAIPYRPVLSLINHWYTLPQFFVLPMHYAKQFHADFNPKADELAKELGYETWTEAMDQELNKFPNMFPVKKVPTTGPWVLDDAQQLKRRYVRNPYYHAVDIEGNQLPYIDYIEINVASNIEVSILDALQGKSDVAGMYLKQSEMALYKEYEEKGNYRLLQWERIYGAYPGLTFNQNHQDPAKREVFQNLKFRQAMSVAINREEMNELVFLGLGVPQQATIHYGASFYDPRWAESYAQYDPDLANKLLDEIGLKKGSDGFRRLADGSVFQIEMNTIEEYIEHSELVRDYWEAVGIKTDLKQISGQLLTQRQEANEFDLAVQEADRMLELRAYIPFETLFDIKWGWWARSWNQWLEDPTTGDEPPQEVKDYYSNYMSWLEAVTDEEYEQYGKAVFDFYADYLPVIGTVAWPVAPIIISNRIQNVLEKSILSDDLMWFKVSQPAQWYVTE